MNGKPQSREWGNRGGQQRSQYLAHLTEEEKKKLNNEEIEKLRGLIESLEKPSSSACLLALSCNSPLLFVLNISEKCLANSWIIDSGATNHMTYTSQYFSTYIPCPSSRKITVANGSLFTVAGLGDIYVTPNLILNDVQHVPKLSANLVSVTKLTVGLKYYAIFDSSCCVFQEQGSGRKIGLAKEKDELYYHETVRTSKRVVNNLSMSVLSSSNKIAIWLHHFCFGHPSFRVLNAMYPSLF